jgi:pimeloyl-ACP methyl ester carboxylesterase
MRRVTSMDIPGGPALARGATLPAPVEGERIDLNDVRAGEIAVYADESQPDGKIPPLLLVHSVNAAATAYEMRPLFDHYRGRRAVYALDLPGFGHSDRSERVYTPRLMTDAVLAAAREIRGRTGEAPIDVIALSLGCEFVARAATEMPNAFRTLALVSPTGFDKRGERAAQRPGAGGTRAIPWLHALLNFPLWNRGVFSALTSRPSIRYFLQKTWGSKVIDEGLLEYDYMTTHQPDAENAPYYFVSGYLFSLDAIGLYCALAMPVWMAHGVRGDFVDYERKGKVQALPNWSIQVFQTGAMPHFERPSEFISAYDNFVRRAVRARSQEAGV